MKLLILRIKACWNILTQKKKHWVMLSVSEQDLIKLIKNEDVEIEITYHKMQKFTYTKLIKMYGDHFDEVDMLQEQLRYELKAEQFAKRKVK